MWFAALACALGCSLASGQDAQLPAAGVRIDVRIPGGRVSTFAAADLARLPRTVVRAEERGGSTAAYEGPAIGSLLAQAGVALGKDAHGPDFVRVVIVVGSDGYRAVFSLPELDSSFTDGVVILADRRNGSPLEAKDGPYRLIVGADRRPTRWVRNVTGIEVLAP